MILFMEIFGMLLVVIILYILINYIYNNVLNVSDKRVALDHLPVPIYFGLSGKYPLVVNDKMYDLIYSIKNKPLTDMDKDFECLVEDHLKTDEIRDALDDEYKNGFFVRFEDKIYFIDKKTIDAENDTITEIIGQDTTEEYNNLCRLKELNDELKAQNLRLKKHFDNIALINREQELLNAKISIHAKLGECITMTRHFIKTPDDKELKGKVLGMWQQIILGFSDVSADSSSSNSGYEELKRISKLVRCDIIINGSLPDGEAKPFMIKIIREALNNAIRHANATTLTVDLSDFAKSGNVKIYDNGSPDKPFTKMGGGLSSLKENLEQNGIILSVDNNDRFTINLSFPEKYRE